MAQIRCLLGLLLACCLLSPSPITAAKKSKTLKAAQHGGGEDNCPGLKKGEGSSGDARLRRADQLVAARDPAGAMACALGAKGVKEQRAEVLFNVAVTFHQTQQPAQALAALQAIPEALLAKNGQANHLLGVLLLQQNDPTGAIKALKRASVLRPGEPLVYTALAQAHYDLQDPAGAVAVWQEGCYKMPSHAEGFFNVGILLRELGGRLGESERSYRTAIRLAPNKARYRYSYGNLLYDLGLLSRAAAVYRQALRIEPGHEDASNNLGNALRQEGQLGAARGVFEAAIALNPQNTNLLLNAGQVYQDLGMVDRVEEVGRAAFAVNPRAMEASLLLGSVAYVRADLKTAAEHYRVAHAAAPGAQQPLLNLANTLGDLYRHMEARMANQNEESRAEMLSMHTECVASYDKLLLVNPNDGEAFMHMMWARKFACDWHKWHPHLERMEELIEESVAAGKPPAIKPFLALAFPIPAALYIKIAKAHADDELKKSQRLLVLMRPLSLHRSLLPRQRIRLGYLSTDLGDHPVGHQAWFWAHDTQRFDVVLFALSNNDDSLWWRNNSAMVPEGNWVELGRVGSELSASDLADKVNERQIHVLVTLNGWTSGNQIDSLAMRPAPLQVEYMGSHDSIGGDFIDIFVSDRTATPPEYATPFFSEKLAIMPYSFFMNEYANSRRHVPHRADRVFDGEDSDEEEGGKVNRGAQGLPEEGLLLCNFNQLFKVDPEVFGVWMDILSSVQDSFLWLLRLPSTAEANLRRSASDSHGAHVEKRMIFSERIDWRNHLIVKSLANLSLDNPVFNSHTSGVDILWSGVPLLTLPRETMSSRVAASLINAVTLPLTIARNMQDYKQLALRLIKGGDGGRQALRTVRQRLMSDRIGAPLFDTRRMTQEFEASLLMAWQVRESREWKGGQLESHLVVGKRP